MTIIEVFAIAIVAGGIVSVGCFLSFVQTKTVKLILKRINFPSEDDIFGAEVLSFAIGLVTTFVSGLVLYKFWGI